ncbi:RidA family protein [Rhodococcus sp. NPDC057529]|uniref:RidA family protein n=1 Tax=Rhodococcus sp. NPDC057529 TaxID=3346158 RepID=UPI00366F24A9
MTIRNNISSGSQWEAKIGFSRAVRFGQFVSVSGTTSAGPDGNPVGGSDIGEQTREILRRLESILEEAGATTSDVVRTRIYLTDISRWEEVAVAHGEVFGEIRPAHSMVEVSALVNPQLLVEIEADAILSD